MKRVIWKYPLSLIGQQEIFMPANGRILAVQLQVQTLCIWAEVDPDAALERRLFEIIGTGHPYEYLPSMPENSASITRQFITTVQRGIYVWHVFEIR